MEPSNEPKNVPLKYSVNKNENLCFIFKCLVMIATIFRVLSEACPFIQNRLSPFIPIKDLNELYLALLGVVLCIKDFYPNFGFIVVMKDENK